MRTAKEYFEMANSDKVSEFYLQKIEFAIRDTSLLGITYLTIDEETYEIGNLFNNESHLNKVKKSLTEHGFEIEEDSYGLTIFWENHADNN